MQWFNNEIATLPRQGSFPFQVKYIYICHRALLDGNCSRVPPNMLEVCLRLASEDSLCPDIVNDRKISVPFPNVAFKYSGAKTQTLGKGRRDVISFAWADEVMPLLKAMGLYSEEPCIGIRMTPEIERLVQEFRKCFSRLALPGMVDRMDWICFQLYRELYYERWKPVQPQRLQEKIVDIAGWIQIHYNENIDFEAIAQERGFSRATFFREWKKYFPLPPLQYQNSLKLESAYRLLQRTMFSIEQIVNEVNFSGTTAFHRKFMEKYGVTLGAVRRNARERQEGDGTERALDAKTY